jgi:hypothetical protein
MEKSEDHQQLCILVSVSVIFLTFYDTIHFYITFVVINVTFG